MKLWVYMLLFIFTVLTIHSFIHLFPCPLVSYKFLDEDSSSQVPGPLPGAACLAMSSLYVNHHAVVGCWRRSTGYHFILVVAS